MNKLMLILLFTNVLHLSAQKTPFYSKSFGTSSFSTEILDSIVYKNLDSGVLVPSQKQVFTYNNFNKITESVLYSVPYNPAGVYEYKYDLRELYFYDQLNRVKTEVAEEWDSNTNSWNSNFAFNTYKYEGSTEKLDSVFYYVVENMTDTTLFGFLGFTYNSDGKQILEESYIYPDNTFTPVKSYREETVFLSGDTIWRTALFFPTDDGLNWELDQETETHKRPDENGEYLIKQFVYLNDSLVELSREYYEFNSNKNWLYGYVYFNTDFLNTFDFVGKYDFYWRETSSLPDIIEESVPIKGVILSKGDNYISEKSNVSYCIFDENGRNLVRGSLSGGLLKTEHLPCGSYSILFADKSIIRLIII
jgi:hypothetical protein